MVALDLLGDITELVNPIGKSTFKHKNARPPSLNEWHPPNKRRVHNGQKARHGEQATSTNSVSSPRGEW